MIDKEHVKYIAKLARLAVTEEEINVFTSQIDSILQYVDQLNTVDTGDVEPTAYVSPRHDPMRDDDVQGALALPREKLLRNGPSVKKGYFAVPRIITH